MEDTHPKFVIIALMGTGFDADQVRLSMTLCAACGPSCSPSRISRAEGPAARRRRAVAWPGRSLPGAVPLGRPACPHLAQHAVRRSSPPRCSATASPASSPSAACSRRTFGFTFGEVVIFTASRPTPSWASRRCSSGWSTTGSAPRPSSSSLTCLVLLGSGVLPPRRRKARVPGPSACDVPLRGARAAGEPFRSSPG